MDGITILKSFQKVEILPKFCYKYDDEMNLTPDKDTSSVTNSDADVLNYIKQIA